MRKARNVVITRGRTFAQNPSLDPYIDTVTPNIVPFLQLKYTHGRY
jgi:hypothetical protein